MVKCDSLLELKRICQCNQARLNGMDQTPVRHPIYFSATKLLTFQLLHSLLYSLSSLSAEIFRRKMHIVASDVIIAYSVDYWTMRLSLS